MIREEDYEFIFKRKAIRKYDMNGLDGDTLTEVSDCLKSLTPLIPGISTELRIIPGAQVSGMGIVKAPHYAVIFSEEKPGFEANAGFMLQQANLFFASKGLGSCWVGAASPDGEAKKQSSLKYVINMAFGKPEEAAYRCGEEEFIRKSAGNICDFGGDGMTQCVRLAPSAMNSQPWFFTKEEGGYGVYRLKPNPIKALIMDPMNKIDMGIALCHAAIYQKKEGKPFGFTLADGQKDGVVKGGVRFGRITTE